VNSGYSVKRLGENMTTSLRPSSQTTAQLQIYHYSHHMSVKLESSDEQVFDVPREIAEMSVTVKHMLDDVDADSDAPIPLPNVTGKILAKVGRTFHHDHQQPTPERA